MDIGTSEEYQTSIRALFPEGEWWDRQWEDPESDLCLWVHGLVAELLRLKLAIATTLANAYPTTCDEQTIDPWERIFGLNNSTMTLSERHRFLSKISSGVGNLSLLRVIASTYGATISSMVFPYAPSFFGFAAFGLNRASLPAVWAVVEIHAECESSTRPALEAGIKGAILKSLLPVFVYEE